MCVNQERIWIDMKVTYLQVINEVLKRKVRIWGKSREKEISGIKAAGKRREK